MESYQESRLGIFGGSFNPVHSGHIKAAQEVIARLGLARVVFVPASVPPHKETIGLLRAEDRARMIELAIQSDPRLECSDVELRRAAPSYTIDTLRHFAEGSPGTELYFILGSDLLGTLDTWKDWEDLFTLATLVVIARPGEGWSGELPLALRDRFRYYEGSEGAQIYRDMNSHCLILLEIEGVEVSSTEIRARLAHGEGLEGLVPGAVEEYIKSRGLIAKEAPK